MIVKMEKIFIYGLKGQASDMIEDIMRCGVVEPVAAQSMLGEDASKTLTFREGVDLSQEEELKSRLTGCIAEIKPYSEKRGLLYKRPEVSYERLMDDEMLIDSISFCSEIEDIVKTREDEKKELQKAEVRKTSLEPWKDMGVQVSHMETPHTKLLCYVVPKARDIDEMRKAADERDICVYMELISADEDYSYIGAVCHKKEEKAVRELAGVFGAKEYVPEASSGSLTDELTLAELEISNIRERIEEENRKLMAMADRRDHLELALDAVNVRIDCLSRQDDMLQTEKVDIITGWVIADEKEKVAAKLDKYTCSYVFTEPEEGEEYPVLLKNSKIVAPFGALTEMYSMPNSNSMDSNWAIGLFFFLFFGMMLSDAGYGLILTIGGLGGAKLLDMGEGGKRFLTMMGISGISTMVWGLIFGSFFGDAIPVVADVFFNKDFVMPRLIDQLTEPMTVLALACILGVIHLFTGMGLKAYLMIKRGDKWGALFDVGFWYIFLIGLPCLILPGKLKWIGIIMSVAGGLGLVLTQGRSKPTIIGKITGGIMSLYDVTGYFSDVLSYSRILALGLATGVIASVVNTIGTLTGGGILGAVLFIVIFIFGHALNMAINALGAYVHSARLQYVEFFGKYYESGGRKFNPLRTITKYVHVTEEK